MNGFPALHTHTLLDGVLIYRDAISRGASPLAFNMRW